MSDLQRIVRTPGVMNGKACIRGHRITVATLVGQIAAGYSLDEVHEQYPTIEVEDIQQALRYAADSVDTERTILSVA